MFHAYDPGEGSHLPRKTYRMLPISVPVGSQPPHAVELAADSAAPGGHPGLGAHPRKVGCARRGLGGRTPPSLSLVFDHRVANEAFAARFLCRFMDLAADRRNYLCIEPGVHRKGGLILGAGAA